MNLSNLKRNLERYREEIKSPSPYSARPKGIELDHDIENMLVTYESWLSKKYSKATATYTLSLIKTLKYFGVSNEDMVNADYEQMYITIYGKIPTSKTRQRWSQVMNNYLWFLSTRK